MEIVLFRIRTREDINQEEYQRAFARMLELVSQVPGFVGIEGFAGEDGSELAVARFESLEAIAAWRDQPEHVRTRRRGREEFLRRTTSLSQRSHATTTGPRPVRMRMLLVRPSRPAQPVGRDPRQSCRRLRRPRRATRS